jgi:hypothetical protein
MSGQLLAAVFFAQLTNDIASYCSAAAWDTVEELSAAASHAKASGPEDPLEKFCEEDPSADECRVYED